MVHIGAGLTVTVALQMLLHPFSSVTVTEYIPDAFTVIQFVSSPVLHK